MDEKYPLALPNGTVLAGRYSIDGVLGQGGFGITYRAIDQTNGQKVAIKEFFPDSLAARIQTTVSSFPGERGENFKYGLECFLQEAKTLAQFMEIDGIVKIHNYFQENGTAYFTMDFIEGVSFYSYIRSNGGKVDYQTAENVLLPVIDALSMVHAKGIIHRDVTPDNIYITNEGKIKLLDFGAARYSLGDQSRSLDVVLKHGFAPREQYTRRGKQGPYTDVYSVGASFYFAITGRKPSDSIDRLDEDDLVLPSSLGISIPKEKENVIIKALNVQPGDRFQNMNDFRLALLGVVNVDENGNITRAESSQSFDNFMDVSQLRAEAESSYGASGSYGQSGSYGTSGSYGNSSVNAGAPDNEANVKQSADDMTTEMSYDSNNAGDEEKKDTVKSISVGESGISVKSQTGGNSVKEEDKGSDRSSSSGNKKKWIIPAAVAGVAAITVGAIVIASSGSSGENDKDKNKTNSSAQQVVDDSNKKPTSAPDSTSVGDNGNNTQTAGNSTPVDIGDFVYEYFNPEFVNNNSQGGLSIGDGTFRCWLDGNGLNYEDFSGNSKILCSDTGLSSLNKYGDNILFIKDKVVYSVPVDGGSISVFEPMEGLEIERMWFTNAGGFFIERRGDYCYLFYYDENNTHKYGTLVDGPDCVNVLYDNVYYITTLNNTIYLYRRPIAKFSDESTEEELLHHVDNSGDMRVKNLIINGTNMYYSYEKPGKKSIIKFDLSTNEAHSVQVPLEENESITGLNVFGGRIYYTGASLNGETVDGHIYSISESAFDDENFEVESRVAAQCSRLDSINVTPDLNGVYEVTVAGKDINGSFYMSLPLDLKKVNKLEYE